MIGFTKPLMSSIASKMFYSWSHWWDFWLRRRWKLGDFKPKAWECLPPWILDKAISIATQHMIQFAKIQAGWKKRESKANNICWASVKSVVGHRIGALGRTLDPLPCWVYTLWGLLAALGLEHFLAGGGHYPHEIPLGALLVGKLFFQWWHHLPPPGLSLVGLSSALWSNTRRTQPLSTFWMVVAVTMLLSSLLLSSLNALIPTCSSSDKVPDSSKVCPPVKGPYVNV